MLRWLMSISGMGSSVGGKCRVLRVGSLRSAIHDVALEFLSTRSTQRRASSEPTCGTLPH